jgi:hypothetical protein
MLRHAHFYIKGGLPTFAASAKLKGQREESGRSGHQPVFPVEQTQRLAAPSPLYRISVTRLMAAITREPKKPSTTAWVLNRVYGSVKIRDLSALQKLVFFGRTSIPILTPAICETPISKPDLKLFE